jgi:hypothetical protein
MHEKSKTDNDDPIVALALTASAEPKRAIALKDIELDMWTKEKTDKDDPKRAEPKRDSAEPNRAKARSATEAPM